MTTDTPEACQALCAENKACGEFQWIKVGSNATTGAALKHHQCIFHCQGTNNPGSAQCVLGIKENAPFSEAVCGPQRNNSNAPPPPPAPPSPPAPSPLFPCPVPFGAPRGPLHAGALHWNCAMRVRSTRRSQIFFYTDVRSILMVFILTVQRYHSG